MSELGIRRWTMSHSAVVPDDANDVLCVDTHAVNQKWLEVEHARPLQQRDGRPRARCHDNVSFSQRVSERPNTIHHELALERTLGDVHRDWHPATPCECGGGNEEIVGD